MRVGLSGLNLKAKGGGIDNYAKRLYRGLLNEGIDVKPIWVGHLGAPLSKILRPFFPQLLYLAKKYKGFDIIHAAHPGTAVAFPLLKDVKKIVSFHDLAPLRKCHLINRPVGIRNRLFNPFNYVAFSLWFKACKWADHVIAVSTQTKEDLVNRGWREEGITVIPEYAEEKFRPMGLPSSDKKIAGYFGPIVYRKRPHEAIEALSYLGEEWELWLCGLVDKGHDYWHYQRDYARKLGVGDRVKFRGWIPDEELVETINMFDVMLFPTSEEGFGLPILEVSMCGIPVIVKEDSRIPKEIKDLCFTAKSARDMALKAERIVLEGLCPNSKKIERFTEERVIKETIAVYEKLLE